MERPSEGELIFDNAFTKQRKYLPSFLDSSGPGMMTRALTFDERSLLKFDRDSSREFSVNKNLTRASTMVSRHTFEVKEDTTIANILFRRHFSERGKNKKAVLPSYSGSLSIPALDKSSLPQVLTPTKYVIVLDPYGVGAKIVYELTKIGIGVIGVLSHDLKDVYHKIPAVISDSLSALLSFKDLGDLELSYDQLQSEIDELRKKNEISAVMVGAETGVELAEKISNVLNLRCNVPQLLEARLDKYKMIEELRKNGLRAPRQIKATTWGEIAAFIEEWNPTPFEVIAKPLDSGGSEDASLCRNIVELQDAFGHIVGKINSLGVLNEAVLVQEYLSGEEYVVDMVSRDGHHTAVALWKCDKRPANGSSFVFFGQTLLSFTEEDGGIYNEIISYQKQVLDSLGIRNGPSHGKIMWSNDSPILIEVGSHCHGRDGHWIDMTNEALGYNQVNVSIDAYLSEKDFQDIPTMPMQMYKQAKLKYFVVQSKEGILKNINQDCVNEIMRLHSYASLHFFVSVGDEVKPTSNCFTWGGCVCLQNIDSTALQEDYERAEEIEMNLFEVEVAENLKSSKGFVAIVDPFSTGASLAAFIFSLGYKIIAIYSANMEQLSTMKNLIPQNLVLEFDQIITFDRGTEGIAETLQNKTDIHLIAVMAGAETGVELADNISSRLGLRTNGTEYSLARRNKYHMGETIRKNGVRAVKQVKATSWTDVQEFLKTWKPDPFNLIIKPINSAGSEDVTLCKSIQELEQAFHRIIGKVNGLGLLNEEVLVQEYLSGQEYVVDMVSRDGEHKAVALWQCDKRPVNGASFVLFGYIPILATDSVGQALIEYLKSVLDALGIQNGPSHGEVKWENGEPVLVEVGARCHGGEGTWVDVANAVYGYNQVNVTASVYLPELSFDAIPSEPLNRQEHGRLLCLVCKVSGLLVEICADYIEELRNMRSFIRMEIFLKPGQHVKKTIDCFTLAGVVMLSHRSEEQVIEDYQRLREMEDTGLFICE